MNIRLHSGFTLIELMIVVAVIAVLAVIAVPAYNDSVTKARRSDGQAALMDAMARQERFFTQNNTYTTNFAALPLGTGSPDGHYTLSAAACAGATIATCVIVTAAPQARQAHDGALTLNSRGQKLPADKW